MFALSMGLVLVPEDHRTLEQMLRQATLSQAIAKCERVVLRLADGDRNSTNAETFSCTDHFIAIWKRRLVEGGALALAASARAGRGHGISASPSR